MPKLNQLPRGAGLFYVLIAYALALGVAVLVGKSAAADGLHPLAVVFMADAAATGVVFLFSLLANNSSIYDPYWSAAVPIIFLAFLSLAPPRGEVQLPYLLQALLLLLVCVWAIRLTANWMSRWQGFGHEDWRYGNFRQSAGGRYWLVSLFGIHLFPTIVVYLGSLSLYVVAIPAPALKPWISWAGALVCLMGIVLETGADMQMSRFKMEGWENEKATTRGLWGRARHPNYLGELLFWWGLSIAAFGKDPAMFSVFIGPAAITLLFRFISIPMMEKRLLASKAGYQQIINRLPMLLPIGKPPPRENVSPEGN